MQSHHVRDIGYLPEERGLYKKMKVGEQAMYLAQLKGLSKADAKIRLQDWFTRFEIEGWWNKKVEELSKGMAQKVQFITTVLHEPKLLILDEPFSGFDPINVDLITNEIMRLKDEGATVILSTHNMNSVEALCDNISLIHRSKVVLSGKVGDIKNQYKNKSYRLKFSGNLIAFTTALWISFKMTDKTSEGDVHSCTITIADDSTVNDLLNAILPVVSIHEITEIIPSMHDIFIAAVEEKVSDFVGNE
jgi:ABC-2 type transport system ATP-binding protein